MRPKLKNKVLSLHVAPLTHLSAKTAVEGISGVAFDHGHRRSGDVSDPVDLPRLLRLGGARRGEQRGSTSNECPALDHSITWSARASSAGGMVRPRALAVLRLMASSNLSGCSTGRDAGSVA